MSKNPILSTLLMMAGDQNTITVHKAMVDFLDGFENAALFEQLLYWTPKSSNGGWVAKSDKEFIEELHLSRYALRKARSFLEAKGLIATEIRKFDGSPTAHYRVDMQKLNDLWVAFYEKEPPHMESDYAPSHNPLSEIGQTDYAKTDNPLSETEQSLTEITTETTAEIKDTHPILEKWAVLFPEKPQPRLKTYASKIKTRMSDPEFVAGWEAALKAASESPTLHGESWFSLEYFLRNDENWRKCRDRWMAWKDKSAKPIVAAYDPEAVKRRAMEVYGQ